MGDHQYAYAMLELLVHTHWPNSPLLDDHGDTLGNETFNDF